MEHAPLRPIPARPAGPVDPGAALALVGASLPGLEERAARALALVALAGRPRSEAAIRLELGEEELAVELTRARKELRRSMVTLTGRGWCERAERLVSDRLDGALTGTGAARLDVHLRNCSRCVEHERRLVQATDALVAALPAAAPRPVSVPPAQPAPAPLQLPTRVPDPEPPPSQPPAAGHPQPAHLQPRSRSQLARATGWYILFALAIILALASLALTIAGVLGAEL